MNTRSVLKEILEKNPNMRINLNTKSSGFREDATSLFMLAYRDNIDQVDQDEIRFFISRQYSDINIDLNAIPTNPLFIKDVKSWNASLSKEDLPSVANLLIKKQRYALLRQCLEQNGFSINLTKAMIEALIQDNQKELLLKIIKQPNNKMQPDKIAAIASLCNQCMANHN